MKKLSQQISKDSIYLADRPMQSFQNNITSNLHHSQGSHNLRASTKGPGWLQCSKNCEIVEHKSIIERESKRVQNYNLKFLSLPLDKESLRPPLWGLRKAAILRDKPFFLPVTYVHRETRRDLPSTWVYCFLTKMGLFDVYKRNMGCALMSPLWYCNALVWIIRSVEWWSG